MALQALDKVPRQTGFAHLEKVGPLRLFLRIRDATPRTLSDLPADQPIRRGGTSTQICHRGSQKQPIIWVKRVESPPLVFHLAPEAQDGGREGYRAGADQGLDVLCSVVVGISSAARSHSHYLDSGNQEKYSTVSQLQMVCGS